MVISKSLCASVRSDCSPAHRPVPRPRHSGENHVWACRRGWGRCCSTCIRQPECLPPRSWSCEPGQCRLWFRSCNFRCSSSWKNFPFFVVSATNRVCPAASSILCGALFLWKWIFVQISANDALSIGTVFRFHRFVWSHIKRWISTLDAIRCTLFGATLFDMGSSTQMADCSLISHSLFLGRVFECRSPQMSFLPGNLTPAFCSPWHASSSQTPYPSLLDKSKSSLISLFLLFPQNLRFCGNPVMAVLRRSTYPIWTVMLCSSCNVCWQVHFSEKKHDGSRISKRTEKRTQKRIFPRL